MARPVKTFDLQNDSFVKMTNTNNEVEKEEKVNLNVNVKINTNEKVNTNDLAKSKTQTQTQTQSKSKTVSTYEEDLAKVKNQIERINANSNSNTNANNKFRKPLVQKEPAFLHDIEAVQNHNTYPEGVEIRKVKEEKKNNVEYIGFNKVLNEMGILPTSWTSGKYKNPWRNLVENLKFEFSQTNDDEVIDEGYIIELPRDNESNDNNDLVNVSNLTPASDSKKIELPKPKRKARSNGEVSNYDLFYGDATEDDLDVAPNIFEGLK